MDFSSALVLLWPIHDIFLITTAAAASAAPCGTRNRQRRHRHPLGGPWRKEKEIRDDKVSGCNMRTQEEMKPRPRTVSTVTLSRLIDSFSSSSSPPLFLSSNYPPSPVRRPTNVTQGVSVAAAAVAGVFSSSQWNGSKQAHLHVSIGGNQF